MSKEVEFRATIINNRYNSEEYKIYVADVNNKIYPNIQSNKNNEFVLVGNMPNLVPNIEYDISASIEINKNYGIQYKVKNIRRDKPTDLDSAKSFLEEVLTEKQAKVLLSEYPNIIDKVVKNDLSDIDLDKLHGIGQKTFNDIKAKIIENFCLIDLVDKFGGLIDMTIIKKLYDKYTNVKIVEKELRQDPYRCLCELSRVAFKTADSILLNIEKMNNDNPTKYKFKFNYELKHSTQRMKSCLNYILRENESSGNTKMTLKEARVNCGKLVPECIDLFVSVIKESNEDIYIDMESKMISTVSAYNTEKQISDFINDINENPITWGINYEIYREVENMSMTDEQLETLGMMCNNNIGILTASGGCVDCDTEFFNGYEWKKISEYSDDFVLQYNSDGSSNLVKPTRYIKQNCNLLYHMKNKSGSVDQVLSNDHNVVYMNNTKKNPKLTKDYFSNIRMQNENNKKGFNGRFITTFNHDGKGINLSEYEIRLMCAVISDGNFSSKNGKNRCRINLKKQRKKDRLEYILNKLNIEYSTTTGAVGYKCYLFKSPRIEKEFTRYWYDCSNEQYKIIADEILYWDGCIRGNRKSYSTTSEKNANFIQFAFSAIGVRATIGSNDRIGEEYTTGNKKYIRKSKEYTVVISNNNTVSIRNKDFKNDIKEYKTKDGYEYCFTVDSSMLILRRNNRIFITGNCGKSASVKALINMLEDNNKTYRLMTPTGASSKVLEDYTKRKCGTIHRQLEYKPTGDGTNPWGYNENNKLTEDIVIVDEFSMVDIFLFKHLIDAIDTTKTKLLLVFDPYQLSSVACGNVAQDLLSSEKIPTTILTKIFRYGEGGLMNVVTKIRNSEKFLPSDFKGTKVFGSKKDFIYCELAQELIQKQVLKIYGKLLSDGYSLQDIMVLSSQNKGDYGTKAINKHIQSLMQRSNKTNFVMRGDTKFHKGDKVIQIINNYKAETPLGEETQIFNGNTGVIVAVKFNEIEVEFDKVIIRYSKEDLHQLELGYCISIHKSQGSSAKQVIVIAPRSHSFMLNSNLLYVGGTRAKERVYVVGNIVTINSAIKKKENLARVTWLRDILK